MNEVPLIEKVQKNDINTTIIAIKKQLKELNALLGLIDIQSDKQDLSPYVRKDEVIDEVKRFDLSPVTSNAVSKAISYSTDEVKTGAVWLDGKPIYRKCGNTEATGVWGGAGDVSLNLSWFKQSVVGDVNIINMEYHQTGKSGLGMRVVTITTSGVSFNFPYNTGLGYSPSDIIVFEYTKTTD